MLQTKKSSKVLSISLVIALMITLFAGMTFSASAASGYWTDTGNYSTAWYAGGGPYYLSSAEDLAGLAVLVNAGNNFAGETIYLKGDVDLSLHYWVPIGGASPINNGVPTGASFSGIFDGAGYDVGGLFIQFIGPTANKGAVVLASIMLWLRALT